MLKIKNWGDFPQETKKLLNNFWGRFEMVNETIFVKLHKI